MRHYNFYLACLKTERDLSELSRMIVTRRSGEYTSSIMKLIHKITHNSSIIETGGKPGSVNGIFQWVRKAFHLPEKGNLSDDLPYTESDVQTHEKCNLIMEHLKLYLHSHIPSHINRAAKTILDRYRKSEGMLFVNNPDHTIPRTNNGMERFFRKIRRNIRKRTGSSDAGNILSQNGVKTALFQNMGNSKYLHSVFGTGNSEVIASVFAKYRKHFRKKGRTVKETRRLVRECQRMIMDQSSSETPYTEDVFERAKKLGLGTSV